MLSAAPEQLKRGQEREGDHQTGYKQREQIVCSKAMFKIATQKEGYPKQRRHGDAQDVREGCKPVGQPGFPSR